MKNLSEVLQKLCLDDGAGLTAQVDRGVASLVGETPLPMGPSKVRAAIVKAVRAKANALFQNLYKSGKYPSSALFDILMSAARSEAGKLSTQGVQDREDDDGGRYQSAFRNMSVFQGGRRKRR